MMYNQMYSQANTATHNGVHQQQDYSPNSPQSPPQQHQQQQHYYPTSPPANTTSHPASPQSIPASPKQPNPVASPGYSYASTPPNSAANAMPPMSPQCHQHHQQQHHQQHQQHQQGPGKIPDIILTGEYAAADIILAGVEESLRNQDLVKDLGNAMAGVVDPFDSDFLTSDEALKMGLDPLDLDGLQMLTDPTNMVTDSATEDSFRLDRL